MTAPFTYDWHDLRFCGAAAIMRALTQTEQAINSLTARLDALDAIVSEELTGGLIAPEEVLMAARELQERRW